MASNFTFSMFEHRGAGSSTGCNQYLSTAFAAPTTTPSTSVRPVHQAPRCPTAQQPPQQHHSAPPAPSVGFLAAATPAAHPAGSCEKVTGRVAPDNVSADTLVQQPPTQLFPNTATLHELELQPVHSIIMQACTSPSQQHHSAPPAPSAPLFPPQAAPLVGVLNRRNWRTAAQAAKKDSSRHH